MDNTAPDKMEKIIDESKIEMQKIKEKTATFMKEPVPNPKEATYTAQFIGVYITLLFAWNLVVASTFGAAWATVAEIFVLKLALPAQVQSLASEAELYLKKVESNLSEIENTVQKVTAAAENDAKISRKDLKTEKKRLESKLKRGEEYIEAVHVTLDRLTVSCHRWLIFLAITGAVIIAASGYIGRGLLQTIVKQEIAKILLVGPRFFDYAVVALMVVSCYKLAVFLYNYFTMMCTQNERLHSKLREVTQQQKEKVRSVQEMLNQLVENLDADGGTKVQEL